MLRYSSRQPPSCFLHNTVLKERLKMIEESSLGSLTFKTWWHLKCEHGTAVYNFFAFSNASSLLNETN